VQVQLGQLGQLGVAWPATSPRAPSRWRTRRRPLADAMHRIFGAHPRAYSPVDLLLSSLLGMHALVGPPTIMQARSDMGRQGPGKGVVCARVRVCARVAAARASDRPIPPLGQYNVAHTARIQEAIETRAPTSVRYRWTISNS
jgi:hypothetical protein